MNDKRKNQTNYRNNISSFEESNNYTKKKKKEIKKTKTKNGYILCEGIILEAYPNARFLVEIDNVCTQINATLAGKLRQNYIRILVGDRVELELSVYDMTQGRISRRI